MNFFSRCCCPIQTIEPQIQLDNQIISELSVKPEFQNKLPQRPKLEVIQEYIVNGLLYLFEVTNERPVVYFELQSINLQLGYSYEDYCHFLALKIMWVLGDQKVYTFKGQSYVSSLYLREVTSFYYLKPVVDYFKPKLYLKLLEELKTPAILSLILNIFVLPVDPADCSALVEMIGINSRHFVKTSVSESDISMIQLITNHTKVIEAIKIINNIRQEELCEEETVKKHIQQILSMLKEKQVVKVNGISNGFFGFTTYSGEIYLNSNLSENFGGQMKKNRITILRQITLLHELFGHIKRITYSDPKNVFQRTPPVRLDGQETTIQEAGLVIEVSIFGKMLNMSDITQRFIEEYFKAENWKENFRFEQLIQINNTTQSQTQATQNLILRRQQRFNPSNDLSDVPTCLGYYRHLRDQEKLKNV